MLGMLLIRPDINRARPGPEFCERRWSFENMRSVRKLRSVPQVSARLVQNAHSGLKIEVQSGGLMILSVDDDHIAGPVMLLDRERQRLGRKNWRESPKRRVHTGQQCD